MNVEYVEEEVEKIIASGVLPLDGLRMSEEEQKNRIFDMLEKEGYDLGDRSGLEVSYDGAETFDETMSTRFVVTKKSLEMVPYEVNKNEIFTGSFILDGLRMNSIQQREKVLEMMRLAGIEYNSSDELEIDYEGATSFEDGMSTKFSVSKVTRKRLDVGKDISSEDNILIDRESIIDEVLAPEEITIQEVEMEEIVNGTISTEGLDSQDEIDQKIVDLLNSSGLAIENVGELQFTYGDVDEHGNMAFSVSRVIVEDAKYRLERELVGSGIVSEDEDVYAIIQKNYGLDVRNDPNYEVIYGRKNAGEQGYKLIKIKRTRLGVVENDNYRNEKLNDSVDEFKSVLNDAKSLAKDNGKFKDLYNKNVAAESIASHEMPEEFRKGLDELDNEIKKMQLELSKTEEEYDSSLNKMKNLIDEEITKLEEKGILTDEEIIDFRENYINQRLEEHFKTVGLKRKIQLLKRQLEVLSERKSKVEQDALSRENVNLDGETYKKIMDIPSKGKNINPTTGVVEAQRGNISNSILDEIDALYGLDTENVSQEKTRKIKARETSLEAIKNNVDNLPEKVVTNNRNVSMNNLSPLDAPEDMIEVRRAKEHLEKIVIYKNLNADNSYYARDNVFKRFNAEKHGEEVKINGASYYKLDNADLEFIRGNSDNDYSPYVIEDKEIALDREDMREKQIEVLPIRGVEQYDNLEKIVIFIDLDNNGERYARKSVFDRFNAKKYGKEVRIDNSACYKISLEDSEFIIGNANNDYSPYVVEMREVHLKGKEDNTELGNDNEKDNGSDEIQRETITIYRDINDNNQLYASASILNKFNIKPVGRMTKIKWKNCYKIDDKTDAKINEIAKKSKNPVYDVEYVDVKIKKKPRNKEEKDDSNDIQKSKPHVEAILDKLTKDLDIRAKDCKRFKMSNLKVANKFKEDLKSGNALYNVFHFAPSLIGVAFNSLRKISAKLLLSERGKKSMTELKRRLDKEFNEEELDVLFDEYRGSQLKADMNSQINDLILDRLREHGLAKVTVMNQNIKAAYSNLFSLLGRIKAIESSLEEVGISKKMAESLVSEKKDLLKEATTYVKTILINRKDANNLLSGGVHGLEEDFKAVSTKLSYVGMRFGKNNNFDNELQHMLGTYGQGLNDALAAGDDEAILDNFMGLESCYYDNTVISKSVFGKRSVGDKYYSPLTEQFDYRDDPFIRDVFATVSIASAAASTAMAFKVHQLESKELLRNQQEQATNVNNANDSIMDYVHETGKDIGDRRAAFQEGMKAQTHQDVLNSANNIERAELDMHNWSFTNSYHAADAQGHEFFNGFHQNVTNQINDITTKYGLGEMTQAEVLQELTGVANNAQSTLNNVSKECLGILSNYAKTHPQFDLTGIKESLDYVVAHPDAISNMNNAMVDVTNLAGGLEGLAANHMTVLESLPSDMASTLVCAAAAVGLALNVSKSVKNKHARKNGYGNEITDMMDDYLNGQEENSFEAENLKSK